MSQAPNAEDAHLPSSIVTEAALIGSMMISPDALDRAAGLLTPDDFAEPLHGRMFDIISNLRAQGAERVSPPLIWPFFKDDAQLSAAGGFGYLAKLTESGAGLLGITDFIRQLRELSDRRRFIVEMSDLCRRAADTSQAVDAEGFRQIAAEAEAVIATASRESKGLRVRSAKEAFTVWEEGYRSPTAGARSRLIPPLNYIMGEARPGEFTVLAGRPGMGKTAFAGSYALGSALDGFGTLFVSLEMSTEQLMARLIADLLHHMGKPIPHERIRDRKLTQEDWRRVKEARELLDELPLWILEEGSFTIGGLRSAIRMAKRRFSAKGGKLAVVVVDYIQLMNGSRRGGSENRTQEVSEITRGMKLLSKDEGVHVFGLSQLSRAVEQRADKRPQLSDLRESGSLEQDADNVIFLFRPEYYHGQIEPDIADAKRMQWEMDREKLANILDIIAAKLRHGRTGSIQGRFYGEYQAVRGRPSA